MSVWGNQPRIPFFLVGERACLVSATAADRDRHGSVRDCESYSANVTSEEKIQSWPGWAARVTSLTDFLHLFV